MIEVRSLTKIYRTNKKQPGLSGALRGLFRREIEETVAVRDVSFSIDAGEFVGFLGPNGAGKTTTLKMLAGLLYPSAGGASVLGYTPWERRDGYRRQFALLLGQKNQLWWDLPARESLALNAKIYGIPRDRHLQTVDELSSLLDVGQKLNVMVRELSLGERMKMELIASLLHRPRVLFLDEPTIGLDVISQKTVREFLAHYNKDRGVTTLLTSHYMADIQELCPRVIIIDEGRLFFDGRLSDVVDRFADSKIVTVHSDRAGQCSDQDLKKFGEVLENSRECVKIRVKRDDLVAVCKALLDELPISDIDIRDMPIEDVIRRLFRREDRAADASAAKQTNPRP